MKKAITKGLCGLLALGIVSGCAAPRKSVKNDDFGFLNVINEISDEKYEIYTYSRTEKMSESEIDYFKNDGKEIIYVSPGYKAQKDDLLLKNKKGEIKVLRKTEDGWKAIKTWNGISTNPYE